MIDKALGPFGGLFSNPQVSEGLEMNNKQTWSNATATNTGNSSDVIELNLSSTKQT